MNQELLGAWSVDFGSHVWIYQLWETESAFIFECIHEATLQTMFKGLGNSVGEALGDGLQQALRLAGK